MNANPEGFVPNWISIPGETLAEWIEESSMSQIELAHSLGLSPKHVNQIIHGKASVSHETALRLEAVTGIPARIWNALEARYREQLARRERAVLLANEVSWVDGLPLQALRRCGAVSATKRVPAELVSQCLRFFGVATVEAWKDVWEQPQAAYRKSPKLEARAGDLATWLRLGELAGRGMASEPFSRKAAIEAATRARGLVRRPLPEALDEVREILATSGVALVVVLEVGATRASGAIRWVGGRPIVQLSGRFKSDDHIWFSLFHELGHVLKHPNETIIEARGIDDPREQEADQFARDILIPPAAWAEALRDAELSEHSLIRLAEEIGVAPGTLVGRLQHDDRLGYDSKFNRLKAQVLLPGSPIAAYY